jgi:hypothetical protein
MFSIKAELNKILDMIEKAETETVSVEESCDDDFQCSFLNTNFCTGNCNGCRLNNCRGCSRLQECMDEG